jgi:predicted nucleic acid binding AN1-type Zn finger protein
MPPCQKESCTRRASTIVGTCAACERCFCLSHRLYEDHDCPQLDAVKKNARDAQGERIVEEARSARRPRVNSI